MEEQNENLRLYCFNNMYLGNMQAGIQSLHTTAEMFVKYDDPEVNPIAAILERWAMYHKTVIILNGGMAKDLQDLKGFLTGNLNSIGGCELPWAYFNESEEALGGVLTNVGIVVPERIYNFDLGNYTCFKEDYYKDNATGATLNKFEFELVGRIKKCRLAS